MQYKVKYKLFFHTFNKVIEDTITVDNGLYYFNGEINCSVFNEINAAEYVRTMHNLGKIEKLFKVPQSIHDSEYGELGATSLQILRCSAGNQHTKIYIFVEQNNQIANNNEIEIISIEKRKVATIRFSGYARTSMPKK